jgi:hypothetical protein
VWGVEKMYNEKLHDMYFLPNIIRIIKSRRMRWRGISREWERRGTGIGYW